MSTFDEQLTRMKTGQGFIAALDNSGGSTPGVLTNYGVNEDEYSGEEEMFVAIHDMRSRLITSPAFTGERILGAILFEDTLDREIEGKPSTNYLWEEKQVAPILKIDKGMAEVENDVQILKPMPELDSLLEKAKSQPIFGTKMRSLIKLANEAGIKAVVEQQFELARKISAAGLVPIIEPEVDIHSPEKAEAEAILKRELATQLETLSESDLVMFKLTLPEKANFYQEFTNHPNMVRVVALSGGYSRDEAVRRLTENNEMIASFSRALAEGLTAQQTDEEFNQMLDESIEAIYQASIT
ncbi:fructose bisphosphate aldolase [Candidatus Pacebacteria bacterium]|nr:fructose bisphosphate aldolase [Candidatus Paceibacterota bacterium]